MISITVTSLLILFDTAPTQHHTHTHTYTTQVKLQLLGEGATPLWVTDLINSGMIRHFVFSLCLSIICLFSCLLLLLYLSLLQYFFISLLLSLTTYLISHLYLFYSYTFSPLTLFFHLYPSRDVDGSAQIL
jgi:hypothetical protein